MLLCLTFVLLLLLLLLLELMYGWMDGRMDGCMDGRDEHIYARRGRTRRLVRYGGGAKVAGATQDALPVRGEEPVMESVATLVCWVVAISPSLSLSLWLSLSLSLCLSQTRVLRL